LALSLLFKSLVILILKPDYWYDEILLSLISRNPLTQLFDTVLAEWLHPPGFTLLLKILPTENMIVSKIIVTTVSLFSIFCAIYYAKRNSVLSKYSTGIALFFSSYTFFLITSDIKQDALTFPLLLVIFFMMEAIRIKQNVTLKESISLFIILESLFFLGYINYLFGFLLIIFVALQLKERSKLYVLISSQIITGILYLPYFINQYVTSKENTIWSYIYPNSIIYAITTSITGMDSNELSDIYLIGIITLVIFGIYSIQKKNEYRTLRHVGLIFLILIPILYPLRFFTISRYIAFPFFILCLFAGVGLEYVTKRTKIILIPLIVFVFLFGMSSVVYITRIKKINTADKNLNAIIQRYSETETLGFVTDNHMFPLAYKLWFFERNKNLIPINAFHPNFLATRESVSKETQTLENRNKTNNSDEIRSLLSKNNLHRYLFVYLKDEFKSPYKRQDAIMSALLKSCDHPDLFNINESQLAYIFTHCFED
jgi:hypothetical protein